MTIIRRKTPGNMLLHVGYQKTGSTWLQRALFDKGRHGFMPWGKERSEQPSRFMWQADRLDCSITELRDAYLDRMRPETDPGSCIVLSYESFVGSAMGGGHNSEWNARTLQKMFPDTRILIMIREQRSMLLSIYAQYVKTGGPLSIDRFLDLPPDARIPHFNRRFYEYHKLVAYYRQLFGDDRVLVLPFEMVAGDADVLVRRLQEFCGLPMVGPPVETSVFNESPNPMALELMRRLNFLRRANALNNYSKLGSPGGRRIVDTLCSFTRVKPFSAIAARQLAGWRSLIEEITQGQYDESNRKLVAMTKLPLVKFGYAVGSQTEAESANRSSLASPTR
jgi:hypothetical protein